MKKYLINEIQTISLSMFRKNFFGIYHGSISARLENTHFIINKQDAIFDDMKQSDLIDLHSKKDYRWNEASLDALIHLNIYKNISEAKYICYTIPPSVMAYTLYHEKIIPKDYFGYMELGEISVYNPKQFEDWYERADVEIYRYMKERKTSIMIIRGYGVYMHGKTLNQIAKKVALLENSCLLLQNTYQYSRNEENKT